MITVGIKALNEEHRVANAIEHALAAVKPFSGRVVLADCGSTDRTIDIARQYPIRILQLADRDERCCGAGAQLAFQEVDTEFFYMQDADMTLKSPFLHAALRFLLDHADVAAVGGHVRECLVESEEFEIRTQTQQAESHRRPGYVDRLDGGGLYRVAAVRGTGYFADRNLHAFEEFELAARLHVGSWKLARIDMVAVDHFGHTMGGYRLMWRRFKSGYTGGVGEVLRGAAGRPHLRFVLGHMRHLHHSLVVLAWWGTLLASARLMPSLLLLLVFGPLLFLRYRRKSLRLAVYSGLYWNLGALGLLTGLFRRRVAPTRPLDAIDLTPATNVQAGRALGWTSNSDAEASGGSGLSIHSGSGICSP